MPLGFRIFVLTAIAFVVGEGLGQALLLGFVCGVEFIFFFIFLLLFLLIYF